MFSLLKLIFLSFLFKLGWYTMTQASTSSKSSSSSVPARVLADLSNALPANATKKSARSGTSRVNVDPMALEILDCFDPLVNALNDRPALLAESSADSGQELPSTQDKGLQILLGSMLSMVHRQNHGVIEAPKYSATGQKIGSYSYPNNKERLDQSNLRVSDMTEVDGPDAIKTLYYLGVNEARFHSYESLRLSLMAVYRQIFNQDWVPLDKPAPRTVAPVKVASAETDHWAKKLAERRAQSA